MLNENNDILTCSDVLGVLETKSNWTQIVCTLNIKVKWPAKYLKVSIGGKDNKFWAGHFGAKFSRICVAVEQLSR